MYKKLCVQKQLQISWCQWQFNMYGVRLNTKFVFLCIKMAQVGQFVLFAHIAAKTVSRQVSTSWSACSIFCIINIFLMTLRKDP